ncbi:MAG TPA: hypothetical protein VGW30_04220 [Gaiellaceae bacterium]|nr:hypothetical protein [Gaiellaceae bacterium]
MVDATAQSAATEQAKNGAAVSDDAGTAELAGAVSFSELVRAHYAWERAGCAEGPAEDHYRRLLTEFQAEEGELVHSYWSTKRPSAVALTIKRNEWLTQLLTDHDCRIRLHRVTDWLARESAIAELLHHCDTLAIKISEVLRGSSERIAMQWLYTVESHLLGYIERTGGRADKAALKEVVRSQSEELIEIERYYARAATKAARIVYFWGMVVGAAVSAALGTALAIALWWSGEFDPPQTVAAQTFFLCFVAGTMGAFISVLMRMSSNSFRIDYEVGRSTIRRLGSFRPFIGAIFGVVLYFVVESGLLSIDLESKSNSQEFFFYGSLAFLAGFNERFTNVILGKAEQTIAPSLGESQSKRRRRNGDEDDED